MGAEEPEDYAPPKSNNNNDMDYQEYMNMISKVRKTREFSRVRAEHYKLASMYAKEKKREEEVTQEEKRLIEERKKIEAEAKTRPQPIPIMPVYPTVQHKPKPRPEPVPVPPEPETKPKIEVKPITQQPQSITKTTTSNTGPISSLSIEASKNALSFNVIESSAVSGQEVEREKGQIDKIQTEQKKPSPSPPKQFLAPIQVEPVSTAAPISSPAKANTIQSATPVEPQRIKLTPMKEFPTQTDVVQKLDNIEEEHRRQQEIRENQIKEEQEKLQKLREEQMKQDKEREEIRRLEFERLRQIQEDQRQLEDERRRQEEHIRLEQVRIEEERRKQERLQAEKNAEYNKQRLEMEAKTVEMNDGQRAIPFDQRHSTVVSPHERVLQERLMQQERLRTEHRKEESQ